MTGPKTRWLALGALALLLTACQTTLAPRPTPSLALAPTPTPTPAPVSVAPATPISPPESSVPTAVEPAAALPEAAPDPTPSMITGEAVFGRLEARLDPKACQAGASSQAWRQRYARSPRAFANHLAGILPLLEFVTTEIERQGLAGEYALIPIVESWYRPDAMGAGGPAGMWQMIGSTARNHGIHIRAGYDGRLSPIESTRAALSYLRTLQDMFGNWQATVMAYNAGEYRLLSAMRRSGSRDVSATARKPHGLSNITYAYIAKLQALSCLIQEPERQGLELPVSVRFRPLVPIEAEEDLDSLDRLAARRGLDRAAVRKLNPGYRGGHLLPGVPRLVLVPADVGAGVGVAEAAPELEGVAEPVADAADEQASARLHEVRSGDSLWSIAKRYGIPSRPCASSTGWAATPRCNRANASGCRPDPRRDDHAWRMAPLPSH